MAIEAVTIMKQTDKGDKQTLTNKEKKVIFSSHLPALLSIHDRMAGVYSENFFTVDYHVCDIGRLFGFNQLYKKCISLKEY